MASNLITATQWPAPSALTSFIAANLPSTPSKAQNARTRSTTATAPTPYSQTQPDPLHTLALQVQHNLQYQHDWADVRLHTHSHSLNQTMRSWRTNAGDASSAPSPSTDLEPPPESSTPAGFDSRPSVSTDGTGASEGKGEGHLLPRPLLAGTPPHHLYIHPDVQTALIKSNKREEELAIEPVIVCPSHIREGGWSLKRMAEVFDRLPKPQRGWVGEILGSGDGEGNENEDRGEQASRGKEAKGMDGKKRMLLAVVESDSTIVYYWVHDGLVKPRQN